MDNYGFRDLRVYQNSISLLKVLYLLMDSFPTKEQFALCDQLRRASVSIPSNIAEGMSRSSDKEKVHFLEISYGSLMEVLCQIEISKELKNISNEQFMSIEDQITIIAKQLSKLKVAALNSKP